MADKKETKKTEVKKAAIKKVYKLDATKDETGITVDGLTRPEAVNTCKVLRKAGYIAIVTVASIRLVEID